MKLEELNIYPNQKAKIPIIQGGMAVRVSTHSLASAVANCGGIGVIAASGMELDELREEIRTARKNITNKDGMLGVNIMFAARAYKDLVRVAIEEGIDCIISGAGFSRDAFKICIDSNTAYLPIVSSVKLAVLSKKLGASAIIIESGEAGGHLGTDKPIRDLIPVIAEAIKDEPSPLPGVTDIPIIAAGGIKNGKEIAEIIKLGANGVQMATRFVLTHECSVSDVFKEVILKATKDDVILIKSPVNMTARAIMTPFSRKIIQNEAPKPTKCLKCLKSCSMDYCIISALKASQQGNYEEGLFFSGDNVGEYNDIISVKEVFERLLSEISLAQVR